MRIELTKGLDNNFYVPKNQYNRNNTRIMRIDIDGNRISESDYYMMGPRQVHITKDILLSDRVYATIANIAIGNKIV